MYDERPVGTHFNQPTVLCGRFTGAGAAVPTPVANVKDSAATRCTIARSGVGALTVQMLDVPLGFVQSYDFWAATGGSGTDKNVRVTAPAPLPGAAHTYTLAVTFSANGVAVDLATTDELCFEIWTARTGTP